MPSNNGGKLSSNLTENIDVFEAYLTIIHFIDKNMAFYTGAEVKAYLYHWRSTHGFKKRSARISLDQLCKGLTKKATGEMFSAGTGLNRETLIKARRKLCDDGLLTPVISGGAASKRFRLGVRVPTPDAVIETLSRSKSRREPDLSASIEPKNPTL